MKVDQGSLLDFIGMGETRFMIPVYQREYSWKHEQCFELWLDIQRAARAQKKHFTGTVLYGSKVDENTSICTVSIIDGQQRVTTLTILLAALCCYLGKTGITFGGITADDIAKRYLRCDMDGAIVSKLVLSRGDRDTLDALISALPNAVEIRDVPKNASKNVLDAFSFFMEKISDSGVDLQALWKGIGLIWIIRAEVDDPDQCQLVFESLNSKGKPLTVADLVRNYLLLTESPHEQKRLYREYWAPMEELFAPDPGSLRLDSGIKGWLSVRFKKTRMRNPETVYSGFKQYVEDTYDGTKEDLLRELRGFSLVWAENFRYHAVKKFKSGYDWAINGAPTLTADYPLKKADNEAYAEKVREELKNVDASW